MDPTNPTTDTGPSVATLESFIIDTFTTVIDGLEQPDGRADQIGGAGTYAIIGARIFLHPSRLVMFIDHTPSTLPEAVRAQLDVYGKEMWSYRTREDGYGTCRGLNRYDGENRRFEYLVPPVEVTPSDILNLDRSLLSSLPTPAPTPPPPSWIHLVSYPPRGESTIAELRDLASSTRGWAPGLVWEPEPPCTVPENFEAIARIIPYTDIVSPNHTEAASLFSIPLPPDATDLSPSLPLLISAIESITTSLVALRPKVAAIVRAGSLGCCYALTADLDRPQRGPGVEGTEGMKEEGERGVEGEVAVYWCPAYWGKTEDEKTEEGKVVDPTGGGNSFMGGLMAAFAQGKSIHQAVVWANVAASFVIEQDGLPRVTTNVVMEDGREVEFWNGEEPMKRVERLTRRAERLRR